MSYLRAWWWLALAAAPITPATLVGKAARFRWGYNDYTDPAGNVWQLVPYNGNRYQTGAAIANTTMPGLYQEGAFGNTSVFAFSVTPGRYRVLVHLSDPYSYHPMNLAASATDGQVQPGTIPSFDPQQAYGGNTAVVIELPNQPLATNGTIYLSLVADSYNGWVVSGVEFLPVLYQSLFPYLDTGLVQCCDVALSGIGQANGKVLNWQDVSGNQHHLLAGYNGGPLLDKAPDGRVAIRAAMDGQFLGADYGRTYDSYTLVLLVYVTPTSSSNPWFGSPVPQYNPHPYLYTDGDQLKTFFGDAYGNYSSIFGRWELIIFSFNQPDRYSFMYQTGRGMTGTENPGGAQITGATLAYQAAVNYRAKLFYDRCLSMAEAQTLINQFNTVHPGLSL